MDSTVSRQTWRTLEPIHAIVYFAPDAAKEYAALGLGDETDRLVGYFPSRAAAMGAVSAEVVQATFFNFAPRRVIPGMDGVWDLVSPRALVDARLRIVDSAMRRLCPAAIDSPELVEAAALARDACRACSPDGRPLYAGNAGLEWPDRPHLQLWHATTLLREFRGDGHIAALVTEGYSGVEAAVTHATQEGGAQEGGSWTEALRGSRGYTRREWSDAIDGLRARGDLDPDGRFSEQGANRRRRVEDATDALALPAWERIGSDAARRLRALGRPIARALVAGRSPERWSPAAGSRTGARSRTEPSPRTDLVGLETAGVAREGGEVWFFDVDGCLVDSLTGTSLRPLTRPVLLALRARGDVVVWWSAGGDRHARAAAERLGVAPLVDAFHGKERRGADGRWDVATLPADLRPDVCVDDRPTEAPVCRRNVTVSPYLAPHDHDRGLAGLHDSIVEDP